MTFFCAIALSARAGWGAAHVRRLAPGGTLLTGIFPIVPGKVGGPPFAVDADAYRTVLEPAGLTAVEIVDKVAPGEQHTPGGSRGGNMVTGLGRWQHST